MKRLIIIGLVLFSTVAFAYDFSEEANITDGYKSRVEYTYTIDAETLNKLVLDYLREKIDFPSGHVEVQRTIGDGARVIITDEGFKRNLRKTAKKNRP